MRIGVISDTHGLVRPEALEALEGVDLLLHAGDVGKPEVIEVLSGIARVVAVRGNNDTGEWADRLAEIERVTVGGIEICMVHDLKELAEAGDADVVVSGHSHKPRIERRDGVLYINPGSAGPRRFSLPVTVGIIEGVGGEMEARIVDLLEQ